RDLEVFLDAQIGEDTASFRHVAHTLGSNAIRWPMRGILTEDRDPTFARRGQTHQATDRRRFARAMEHEKVDDPASDDLKPDAMQDMALAVIGVQAFSPECCCHGKCPDKRPAPPRSLRFPAASLAQACDLGQVRRCDRQGGTPPSCRARSARWSICCRGAAAGSAV